MAARKFKVKFVDGKPFVEKTQPVGCSNNLKSELEGKIERDGSSVKFVPDSIDRSFDVFFKTFVDKVTSLRLTQKNTNLIFSLSEELIKENISLCRRFFDKENTLNKKTADIPSSAEQYALTKLCTVKTAYLRKKELNYNMNYVAPIEKAMGKMEN